MTIVYKTALQAFLRAFFRLSENCPYTRMRAFIYKKNKAAPSRRSLVNIQLYYFEITGIKNRPGRGFYVLSESVSV